jgi:hypothetical protein
MNYATAIGSGATIYIKSLMKTGSGVRKHRNSKVIFIGIISFSFSKYGKHAKKEEDTDSS